MTSSEDQKPKAKKKQIKTKILIMDDLIGGEMRSPIWSDDVTHIYRNLQNRQLGPVSVKEPAFGGL